MTQTTLNFSHPPSYTADDFITAPANEVARQLIANPQSWTMPAIIITGEAGCGKTHLAHIFAEEMHATWLDITKLGSTTSQELLQPETQHYWILEELHALKDETALFHLFNYIKERGDRLLITSNAMLTNLSLSLPDLNSRLRACQTANLAQPDDFLLQAVLTKHFSDQQLSINEDVIHYLLPRIERSFASATKVAQLLDQHALTHKRNITLPLAREVLTIHEGNL